MFLNLKKKMVDLPNGERMAYIEKGEGDNVILLIHGNFSSCLHYEPLFKRIPEGYRVVAMDLRGYGDSSYRTPVESIHDFADDVMLLLEELEIERAVIAGWSLGGCVAMSLAARHPYLTKKLILIASGSVKGYPMFKKSELGMLTLYKTKEELASDPISILPLLNCQKEQDMALMEDIWNRTIYTSASGKRPEKEASEAFIRETLKQRNLVDADWALMHFNISGESSFYSRGENLTGSISCPVLALNGRQDIAVPRVMINKNRQKIRQIVQKYYEDCGHSLLNDEPDELAKDILEFVQEPLALDSVS